MSRREPIAIPSLLRFPALSPCLGRGWNEVEVGGTWACDNEAEVYLRLDEAAEPPLLLKLRANHCLPPDGYVTVSIETETGTSLLSFQGAGPDVEKDLIIWERDVDKRHVVKLILNSPSVFVPYEIDKKVPDLRKLSILLRSIELSSWPRLSVGDELGFDGSLGPIVGQNLRRDDEGRYRNERPLASVKFSLRRDIEFPVNVVLDFGWPDGAEGPLRLDFWNFARTLGSLDVEPMGDFSKSFPLSRSDLDGEFSTEIFCRISERDVVDGMGDEKTGASPTLFLTALRILAGFEPDDA